MQNIPWCEKYRPNDFENIILDPNNKIIFENILKNKNFPNLLLYGPPGTGKTTTIINLINKYQDIYYNKCKSLVIHLNASDERGIDIIRYTIYNFINSNNLFIDGIKFVILDEVDYMTKIAQQALKCLIQENNINVRYCLICNYISKIDYSLQDEFIKIRFNQLPKTEIINLLTKINAQENIVLSNKLLKDIVMYFNNDIRSMVNYIQSNIHKQVWIIDNNIFKKLYEININKNVAEFNQYINNIEHKYQVDKPFIIKKYVYFLLTNKINNINKKSITDYEYLIHNIENNNLNINYIYHILAS
jgi:DNA polymerase III delta prime subunit